MPYSKEHKAQTRERIIKSAQTLLKKHGYKNISIDQVMADADLTRGGFYAHFKSKKALITASLDGSDGRVFMASVMGESNDGDLEARVDHLLTGYLSISHRDNAATGCPVAAMGNSVEHVGGEASIAYAKLVDGMVLTLQKGVLAHMAKTDILAVIAQAVGCLNMARATAATPDLSIEILASGRKALKEFILKNSS